MLNTKRLVLLSKLDLATDEAKQSLEILQETGHQDSPFIAEAQAVLADLHCRKDEVIEGQALLKASRHY